jgi:uncharacterized membrane protein
VVKALFFVPVIGGVAGAAIGAFSKATGAPQINIDQLETTRTQATEGTSALFVVTEGGDLDRLGERFRGRHSKLIARTSLRRSAASYTKHSGALERKLHRAAATTRCSRSDPARPFGDAVLSRAELARLRRHARLLASAPAARVT